MKIEIDKKPDREALKKAVMALDSREAVADALSNNTVATLKSLGITVDSDTAKAIQSRAQTLKTSEIADNAAAVIHLDF